MALPIDDGILEDYTVVGFWFNTLERWANTYHVDTALAAEEAAQREAAEKGLALGITGVFKGELMNVDGYATWVDPTAKSQEDMDLIMQELGLWTTGQNRLSASVEYYGKKKRWFKNV
jgi:hypothetical protein